MAWKSGHQTELWLACHHEMNVSMQERLEDNQISEKQYVEILDQLDQTPGKIYKLIYRGNLCSRDFLVIGGY